MLVLFGLIPATLCFAALLGLGVSRQAPAWTISFSATFLVFGPSFFCILISPHRKVGVWGGVLALWSLGLFLAMPVYFPGERTESVRMGLAVVTRSSQEPLVDSVTDLLPEEPSVAMPPVPEAAAIAPPPRFEPIHLEDGQIALPYEGDGRNLSVPVVFENGDRVVDTYQMMLDTGATYTTLPLSVLKELGITVMPTDPTITLHTANGKRTAQLVLIDRVWLGDLLIEGVAVSTCDDCSSSETVGLLGLNVANAYNTTIDADRREVIFSARARHSRKLDVRPFVDLNLAFARLPGGRVQVTASAENTARRNIRSLSVGVKCEEEEWAIDLGSLEAFDAVTRTRRLPLHEPCDTYMVTGLSDATW